MIFGLDFLALGKFRQIALDEFPFGWALGAFSSLDGFGDALPAVRDILDSGRSPTTRLHLGWDDDHIFGKKEFLAIGKEAERVGKFYSNFKTIDRRVSGACEHLLNLAKAKELRQIVMGNMPEGVTYVNTPLLHKGGALIPGCVNEVHGTEGRKLGGRYQYSTDGDNATDIDITKMKKKHAGAEIFYFWVSQFNGRKSVKDSTLRPKRTAYPAGASGSSLIDSVIYLKNNRGGVRLPRHWIVKTHAEQHKVPPEFKELKLMIITPLCVDRIELVAGNGQVVGSASYYGTYDEENYPVKRYRYYFYEYGYQIAEKAIRIQGSPIVKIRAKGKRYGRINPAFRAGTFRD